MSEMKPKIWLSSPHMGPHEQGYVTEAFDTNWIAPLGPHVNGFEHDLSTFTGAPHAAALSSGTAALHLGLILLGVRPGDYVICQSMTFSASANPIAYLGATPLFVDSEPGSWNMDPLLLDEAISQFNIQHSKFNIPGSARIAAIIPVHLYGMPANMVAINAVAQKYGIPVVNKRIAVSPIAVVAAALSSSQQVEISKALNA